MKVRHQRVDDLVFTEYTPQPNSPAASSRTRKRLRSENFINPSIMVIACQRLFRRGQLMKKPPGDRGGFLKAGY